MTPEEKISVLEKLLETWLRYKRERIEEVDKILCTDEDVKRGLLIATRQCTSEIAMILEGYATYEDCDDDSVSD